MADFDQNVTINLDVDAQGLQSELGAAAAQIETVEESLDGLDGDLDSASGSLVSFADAARRVDDTDLKQSLDTSNIQGEVETFDRFASSLEKVAELKNDVADNNEVLNQRNQETSESTQAEAESFETLIGNASSLKDAKDAVTNSNEVLDEQNDRTRRSILLEGLAMTEAGEKVDDLDSALDTLLGSQKDLEEQSSVTTKSIAGEHGAARELADGMDGLEGAKRAAANANQKLGADGEETVSVLQDEFDISEKNARSLTNMGDSADGLSDRTQSVTRSIRRMRDATQDSSNAMRAAAEVGDLFEDGLGSLSVNLGAFTIALRNMLTQVPLLLTALGALGAAALGAASGFIVLAGALGALVGAGALAHAIALKEEFGQIEELGQSLEVIMRNLFDVFLEAIQPLLQLNNVIDIFTNSVEGLATGVNMLAGSIAELTEGSQQLQEFAESVGVELFTIQDAIDSFDGSSWENLTAAIMESWVLLGEEVTNSLGIINNSLAGAVRRSAELLAEVDNLGDGVSQFGDTLNELAELGFTIGSGLLPVFESFSSVVERIAAALNSMDDAMLANLITFAALFAATSRVAGTLSSVVRIVPSVVTGFRTIAATSAAATGPLAQMSKAMGGVATKVGGFLNNINAFGGIGNLVAAIGSTSQSFREIAFSSDAATAKFQMLALNSDITAEELQDLAVQGRLTQSQIDALREETEDMNDELRDTQLNAMLTEEQLKELDNVNIDLDDDTVIDPSDYANTSSAVDAASDSLQSMSLATKTAAQGAEQAVKKNGLLAGVMNALSLSTIRARIATQGYFGALKSTIVAIVTAITQKGLMIAANLGLISSELAAAGATAVLDAALTSLTLGLNKVIAAIVLLTVTLGALVVGIIKNFDEIKSASEGVFGFISSAIGGLVNLILTVFVATWEALKMAIEPVLAPIKTLANAFGTAGSAGEGAANSIGFLGTLFNALVGTLSFVIKTIGLLTKVVLTIATGPLRLIAGVLGAFINLLQFGSSAITDFITSWGPFKELFGDTASDANGLIDVITILFQKTVDMLSGTGSVIEGVINTLINGINTVIQRLNTIPGFDVEEVQKVDLSQADADISSDAEVEASGDKNITYNEDNSTNVDQTVNADPEDKSQISRVVKDAMEEANSFSRRQNGFTGN